MKFPYVVGFTVLTTAMAVAVFAAPSPMSGTLTEANATLNYSGGPIVVSDPQAVCPSTQVCEVYNLTVDLPADFDTRRPRDSVRIDLAPVQSADMILALLNSTGGVLQTSDGNATNGAESVAINAVPGVTKYGVRVSVFAGSAASYQVKIALVAGSNDAIPPGPCDSTVFGGADLPCTGNPRYQIFVPPNPSSANAGQGEYNIGYNPHTGRIMNMNIGPIWRITPAEIKPGGAKNPPVASGLPESCPELWENVSDPRTDTGVDPILWTDQKSGRTFATNSTAGAALLFTDNDGGDPPANDQANSAWVQSAQPPNGGADHEGIVTGPFPAGQAALATPANQGQWALYCSQDLVAPSMCQRSLTLGSSWENGFPATGVGCAGLHGHERIAPDGTAWLPVKHCNVGGKSRQGGSISIDTSTSPWTEFLVEKTAADADGPAFASSQQGSGADPSIAFDSNSTAYYCYVNNDPTGLEGHVHVAVGKRDAGKTTIKWIRDVDVGATHGIVNAAHTEAIGGSAGRAACGFFGTNVPGNYQSGINHAGGDPRFPGDWYAFIATTYDEGRTWTTVNATPNDPVQHATGIWQQGGGGEGGDRNLLDFNEITLDDKGRVLYGYSDGCTTAGCIAGTSANDFGASMRVVRQTGGRSLLASFDSMTDTSAPTTPKPACLLDAAKGHRNPSTRDADASHLRWNVPDHGGAAITDYKIYRGTAAGNEVFLRNSGIAANTFDDFTADPNEPVYTYKVVAINAQGDSLFSNEVSLPIGTTTPQNICLSPGLTILTDATGDTLGAGSNAPAYDVQSLALAQPYAGNVGTAPSFTDYKVYFQLKMASLATVPADALWPISFCAPNVETSGTSSALVPYGNCANTNPNAAQSATNKYYTVRMSTVAPATPATPAFEILKPNAANTTRTIVTADAASNFKADGRITIVAKASDIGLTNAATESPTGTESFSKFLVRIGENVVAATVTPDNMPDAVNSAAGTFQTVRKSFCAPNAPPVAILAVDRNTGPAPLTVTFDASGSSEPDAQDTIASYRINFKDGSTPVAQSTPLFSHTYESPGAYGATLTVTDSRGLESTSTVNSIQVIEVTAPPSPPPPPATPANNVLGGALSPWGLLGLGAIGALSRRRRRG